MIQVSQPGVTLRSLLMLQWKVKMDPLVILLSRRFHSTTISSSYTRSSQAQLEGMLRRVALKGTSRLVGRCRDLDLLIAGTFQHRVLELSVS